jgi:hypothetical protein
MDDFFARLALRLLGAEDVTPSVPPPFALHAEPQPEPEPAP